MLWHPSGSVLAADTESRHERHAVLADRALFRGGEAGHHHRGQPTGRTAGSARALFCRGEGQ